MQNISDALSLVSPGDIVLGILSYSPGAALTFLILPLVGKGVTELARVTSQRHHNPVLLLRNAAMPIRTCIFPLSGESRVSQSSVADG